MSILYGFYQADAGEIRVNGKPRHRAARATRSRAGIGMVHQHFMLVEPLHRARERHARRRRRRAAARRRARKARAELKRLAREYGLDVDPDALVERAAGRAAAARRDPEGALPRRRHPHPRRADRRADAGGGRPLFRILRALREQGKTIILITHKLREIMAVTDRVSVMRARRDGRRRATTATTAPAQLAELMVGRRVLLRVEKSARQARRGRAVRESRTARHGRARRSPRVATVALTVRAGEIVGIAGVAGNGQASCWRRSPACAVRRGRIRIDGDDVTAGQRRARCAAAGLPMCPRTGCARASSAASRRRDAALGYQRRTASGDGPLAATDRPHPRRLRTSAAAAPRRPARPLLRRQPAEDVLAREIERGPKLLLVGQPTRGVDIGAIEFIHRRLIALRERGVAILLVSVELDELRGLADRSSSCRRPSAGELAARRDERGLGLLMAGIEMKTLPPSGEGQGEGWRGYSDGEAMRAPVIPHPNPLPEGEGTSLP